MTETVKTEQKRGRGRPRKTTTETYFPARDNHLGFKLTWTDEALAWWREELVKHDEWAKAKYTDIEAICRELDQFPRGMPRKAVVGWGPSSGKTTAQRHFIFHHYREGIIYAAKTREELERMCYDLVAMGLPRHQIALIYANSPDLRRWDERLAQPGETDWKPPVLLITHSRLLTDPIDMWVGFDGPRVNPYEWATGVRKHLMIDEPCELYRKVEVSPADLQNALIMAGSMVNYLTPYMKGEAATQIDEEDYLKVLNLHRDDRDLVVRVIDSVCRNLNLNCEKTPEIERRRWQFYLNCLYYEFRNGNLLPDPANRYRKAKYVSNPVLQFDFPYTYIFDGTGDLLYGSSPKFHTVKGFWRDSIIEMEVLHANGDEIKRSVSGSEVNIVVENWLDHSVMPMLEYLAEKHRKVFLVCWKDMKDEDVQFDLGVDDAGHTRRVGTLLTAKLKHMIYERGWADRFVVTHYMSGQTRGTNDYQDCDAVFCLGHLGIGGIRELQEVTQTEASHNMLATAELVQATYRAQVRHDKPVALYLSGDFWKYCPEVVNMVAIYLKNPQVKFCRTSDFDHLQGLVIGHRDLTPLNDVNAQKLFRIKDEDRMNQTAKYLYLQVLKDMQQILDRRLWKYPYHDIHPDIPTIVAQRGVEWLKHRVSSFFNLSYKDAHFHISVNDRGVVFLNGVEKEISLAELKTSLGFNNH